MTLDVKDKLGELTEDDLEGFSVDELRCSSCSGYGNCGYRMYRLYEGKPILICQQKKKVLKEAKSN